MPFVHVLASGQVASPAFYPTETLANAAVAADGGSVLNLTTLPDAAEPGAWYNATAQTFSLVPPASATGDADGDRDRLLARLHEAYVSYHAVVRKPGWTSLGVEESPDALVATDRWVYTQIALGDRIARAEWLSSRTEAVRLAAVNHIVKWIKENGYTWYSVMIGDMGIRESWKATGVIESSLIYTDLLVGLGDDAGNVRAADGFWGATTTTIHNNYDPELPLLRSA